MVCMGCYLTLLTDFTGVWTVTGCLYGVLPGSIDRPFKCLYGLLLGVTTRSYQSVLTDLSDVCRRCYWVLLWGLTRGYWPTFQRFVCTLIWACWLSYWSVIGRLTRVLLGLLTDLSGVCMECYLRLLTDLSSVCMGVTQWY